MTNPPFFEGTRAKEREGGVGLGIQADTGRQAGKAGREVWRKEKCQARCCSRPLISIFTIIIYYYLPVPLFPGPGFAHSLTSYGNMGPYFYSSPRNLQVTKPHLNLLPLPCSPSPNPLPFFYNDQIEYDARRGREEKLTGWDRSGTTPPSSGEIRRERTEKLNKRG